VTEKRARKALSVLPPKGSAKQFRAEKWLWAASLVPTAVWAIFFPHSWSQYGVLYVSLLSVYALVKGAGGQEQGAEAKEAAENLAESSPTDN
jgi:hypothetical protein